jgi:Rieske Fe-S protein
MSSQPEETTAGVTSRRMLFAGAGAVGAGALLAACGDGNGIDPGGPYAPPRTDDDGPTDDGSGDALANVDDVEVGGGFINASERVVITQPAEGQFRGFSAICTHQGCTVSSVSGGTINCPCHGSRYSIEDGSVVQSAPELTQDTQAPLPEVEIMADGDTIVRA